MLAARMAGAAAWKQEQQEGAETLEAQRQQRLAQVHCCSCGLVDNSALAQGSCLHSQHNQHQQERCWHRCQLLVQGGGSFFHSKHVNSISTDHMLRPLGSSATRICFGVSAGSGSAAADCSVSCAAGAAAAGGRPAAAAAAAVAAAPAAAAGECLLNLGNLFICASLLYAASVCAPPTAWPLLQVQGNAPLAMHLRPNYNQNRTCVKDQTWILPRVQEQAAAAAKVEQQQRRIHQQQQEASAAAEAAAVRQRAETEARDAEARGAEARRRAETDAAARKRQQEAEAQRRWVFCSRLLIPSRRGNDVQLQTCTRAGTRACSWRRQRHAGLLPCPDRPLMLSHLAGR